ncbi:AraC family transcriptional regulator [Streptomyces sp. NPDC051211]|uniref:AraC family transcriptional regulator n=1 Tax=Streptomyces sp. NPDC051211 TaxID=3154643 RepID=UPI00344E541D
MDVFSDVIATMRAGRAKFTRTRRSGVWGNRFGPDPGAGFHVVLGGGCWLIPPAGAPVRLSAGDVVFLPHGAQHGLSDSPDRTLASLPPAPPPGSPEMRALETGSAAAPATPTDPGEVRMLCGAYRLDRGQTHPFLRGLPEVIHLPARLGRHASLRSAVDLLSADLEQDRPGAEAALPALLDLLLVYLLRAWLEEQAELRPGNGWCAALGDPAVAAALNHIHRQPAHPWTVQALGTAVGLSRTAFAKRFTAYVGQSPMAYLSWWRMNTAARLLRADDSPLSAIAQQVGYTSEFAFSHAFKRAHGRAPGRFRREHAEERTGFEPSAGGGRTAG